MQGVPAESEDGLDDSVSQRGVGETPAAPPSQKSPDEETQEDESGEGGSLYANPYDWEHQKQDYFDEQDEIRERQRQSRGDFGMSYPLAGFWEGAPGGELSSIELRQYHEAKDILDELLGENVNPHLTNAMDLLIAKQEEFRGLDLSVIEISEALVMLIGTIGNYDLVPPHIRDGMSESKHVRDCATAHANTNETLTRLGIAIFTQRSSESSAIHEFITSDEEPGESAIDLVSDIDRKLAKLIEKLWTAYRFHLVLKEAKFPEKGYHALVMMERTARISNQKALEICEQEKRDLKATVANLRRQTASLQHQAQSQMVALNGKIDMNQKSIDSVEYRLMNIEDGQTHLTRKLGLIEPVGFPFSAEDWPPGDPRAPQFRVTRIGSAVNSGNGTQVNMHTVSTGGNVTMEGRSPPTSAAAANVSATPQSAHVTAHERWKAGHPTIASARVSKPQSLVTVSENKTTVVDVQLRKGFDKLSRTHRLEDDLDLENLMGLTYSEPTSIKVASCIETIKLLQDAFILQLEKKRLLANITRLAKRVTGTSEYDAAVDDLHARSETMTDEEVRIALSKLQDEQTARLAERGNDLASFSSQEQRLQNEIDIQSKTIYAIATGEDWHKPGTNKSFAIPGMGHWFVKPRDAEMYTTIQQGITRICKVNHDALFLVPMIACISEFDTRVGCLLPSWTLLIPHRFDSGDLYVQLCGQEVRLDPRFLAECQKQDRWLHNTLSQELRTAHVSAEKASLLKTFLSEQKLVYTGGHGPFRRKDTQGIRLVVAAMTYSTREIIAHMQSAGPDACILMRAMAEVDVEVCAGKLVTFAENSKHYEARTTISQKQWIECVGVCVDRLKDANCRPGYLTPLQDYESCENTWMENELERITGNRNSGNCFVFLLDFAQRFNRIVSQFVLLQANAAEHPTKGIRAKKGYKDVKVVQDANDILNKDQNTGFWIETKASKKNQNNRSKRGGQARSARSGKGGKDHPRGPPVKIDCDNLPKHFIPEGLRCRNIVPMIVQGSDEKKAHFLCNRYIDNAAHNGGTELCKECVIWSLELKRDNDTSCRELFVARPKGKTSSKVWKIAHIPVSFKSGTDKKKCYTSEYGDIVNSASRQKAFDWLDTPEGKAHLKKKAAKFQARQMAKSAQGNQGSESVVGEAKSNDAEGQGKSALELEHAKTAQSLADAKKRAEINAMKAEIAELESKQATSNENESSRSAREQQTGTVSNAGTPNTEVYEALSTIVRLPQGGSN